VAEKASLGPGSRLYLIDGSGYIFRAYHALPPLTRKSDGLPVGAVAGFSQMILKLLRDSKEGDKPTHLGVIFDASSVTFRHDIYDGYKANRPPAPEDLVPQFPLMREATLAFGLPSIERVGYEADDIIATYARRAERAGAEVVIISSDKDLMQLVTQKVCLLDTMKSKRISFDQVREKFGVAPEKVIEVQALIGDSVDNVPGVPGIGPKTAAQLIDEFGDLENLLANAQTIKQIKRRESLIEFADQARLSRRLVILKDDVPDLPELDSLGVGEITTEALLEFFRAMEFRSLTRRVEEELTGMPASENVLSRAASGGSAVDRSRYACVQDEASLNDWIARAEAAGVVAFDVETDALDPVRAGLVGFSLAIGPNEACYVPLTHRGGDLADGGGRPEQIDFHNAINAIRPLLQNEAVLKIGQNIKYDLTVMAGHGIDVRPYDDTMLMSYALASGLRGHGMDELSERLLQHHCIKFTEVVGSGKHQKTFDEVALDQATAYAAEDADVTLRLWQVLRAELARSQMASVYARLERPMPAVLSTMERAGIKVDRARLRQLSSRFAEAMAEAEDAAFCAAGERFNLGSPKQIGEVLFERQGLPGGKKTKTGAWSTDASVLEDLAAQGHAVPVAILRWRHYAKLKSTYADALVEAINPATDRVHTSFSLAATTTGRLSSSEPNLQNIPIRTEEGRKIREAFIADADCLLICADYSQIELRLLAHFADTPSLREAFAQGHDIHAMTASQMFGVPIEGMDPMIRRKAKAINFGIIYGISAFGLANNLGIGRDEAAHYIRAYFEKFPGIQAFMEAMKQCAREKGYVETAFGRRCHFPEINARNAAQRAFAERQAINAPLQGTAADIIRRAMTRLPEALNNAGLRARMVLQVHDELVVEAPVEEAGQTAAVLKSVMEKATEPVLNLRVPLVVETGIGKQWSEAH
jgi:DNA polymerase I